jgi:hypothetical protein
MANFQGQRVSTYWYVVLTAARNDGVNFVLTDGQRSKEDQLRLIAQKGVWSPSNIHGAAPYSPDAPHIRAGRQAHALDVNVNDGGESRLQAWLRSQGAHPTNPVPGEAWHLEISEDDLRKLYAKFKGGDEPADEKRWKREYDRLLRLKSNIARRRVLRHVMKERRKVLFHLIRDRKTRTKARVRRYLSLLKRTS